MNLYFTLYSTTTLETLRKVVLCLQISRPPPLLVQLQTFPSSPKLHSSQKNESIRSLKSQCHERRTYNSDFPKQKHRHISRTADRRETRESPSLSSLACILNERRRRRRRRYKVTAVSPYIYNTAALAKADIRLESRSLGGVTGCSRRG